MNIYVGNIFSLISLAWEMSFLRSANAQACQNWCASNHASNAAQWETKCKWWNLCGGCAQCTSGMIAVPYVGDHITKSSSSQSHSASCSCFCLQMAAIPLADVSLSTPAHSHNLSSFACFVLANLYSLTCLALTYLSNFTCVAPAYLSCLPLAYLSRSSCFGVSKFDAVL